MPGTTSSVAARLRPRRRPGPCAPLLARPWVAWDAGRDCGWVKVRVRAMVAEGRSEG